MIDSVIYFGCADKNIYAVSYSAMLKKLRPHTYLENADPLELGEVGNSEPVTAQIEVINDGQAIDSVLVYCTNENLSFDPSWFLLENGSSQQVTITINTPQMNPGIYYLTVVVKSCLSLFEERITKRVNLTIAPNALPETEQLTGVMLGQNYPNPFTGSTSIPVSLTEPGLASVVVTDLTVAP
jgi:hypothetical protein